MIGILTVLVVVHTYFDIWHHLPAIASASGLGATGGAALTVELWISLGIQVLVCGISLLVPLIARSHPEAVHFGWRCLSDYTANQRERIMPLLKRMMGLVSLAVSVFFAAEVHLRLRWAFEDPRRQLPIVWWAAGLAAICAAIIFYYLQRFDEEAGPE